MSTIADEKVSHNYKCYNVFAYMLTEYSRQKIKLDDCILIN